MLNFCTLFDSNYMTRGLTMYHSLEKVCSQFRLYVFAFDDRTYEFLVKNQADWPHLTVISLKELEDKELLRIKPLRTAAEYCWTCTPSTLLYCIRHFNLSHCTYIDADMYFYSDPKVLIGEMGDKSVLISEHRYTKAYDQSWYSGVYCVQFMVFKNTPGGLMVLNWWRDRCIEWCYGRLEEGKFGDQKYLDDWTTRFESVHVLQHLGGGVAPWNVQQYRFDDQLLLTENKTGRSYPLVFFHYHGLKFYANKMVSFCGTLYELNHEVKNKLYFPYVQSLLETEQHLRNNNITGNITGAIGLPHTKVTLWMEFLKKTIVQIKEGKLPLFSNKTFNFNLHYHLYNLEKFL
jgi:hypothetical protein